MTPDSFSDGGSLPDLRAATAHARRLMDAGADWIDVGGESTRPGAEPISARQELGRVMPLIEALAQMGGCPVSIDTSKPEVARAAFSAGATLWNDVRALRETDALQTAADLGGEVVLMHMQGAPPTMQDDPRYDDVVVEVADFLAERASAAERAGVARSRIWLDPGLGFGKTAAHNLALLRGLPHIGALGYRVVVGASRKGLIRALDPSARDATDRLGGSLALALAAARAGATMLRVHDVRQTVQALTVQAALDG